MKKIKYILFPILLVLLIIISCRKEDNGPDQVPVRDRGEEAITATQEIEEYLQTHFYNYEEFDNPPANFDYIIKFDTIAGTNSDKTPLIDQVSFKTVQDRVDEDVTYKLYYLKALQGEGESPDFPDITILTYEGSLLNGELFDTAVNPVRFDLTQIVNGLQDGLVEFNAASVGPIDNGDGTVSYENFGVGAVFIPSGLGYFVEPPPSSNIPLYGQLIFTFKLYEREVGDQDNDGVISILEDINGNGLEEDDNTDGDFLLDFVDPDDDNDGKLTRDEIIIDADGNVSFPDSDGDGTPDYLDADS